MSCTRTVLVEMYTPLNTDCDSDDSNEYKFRWKMPLMYQVSVAAKGNGLYDRVKVNANTKMDEIRNFCFAEKKRVPTIRAPEKLCNLRYICSRSFSGETRKRIRKRRRRTTTKVNEG